MNLTWFNKLNMFNISPQFSTRFNNLTSLAWKTQKLIKIKMLCYHHQSLLVDLFTRDV